jgi:predicted small lipoprotein YifL
LWNGVSMKKQLLLTIFLMMVLPLSACGKRGALVPPESLVPAAVKDLRAEQKGNRFLVCWSQSGKQEWGGPLENMINFRVLKREVLPPDEDCEECPTAYRQVRIVDPEYLQDVRRLGSLYCFFDSDFVDGKIYQYKVISFDKEGTSSRDSNKVRLRKVAPPAPPALTAVTVPTGVVLEWKAVNVPRGGVLEGFAVYRKQGEGVMPLTPFSTTKADATGFEDPQMEHGVKYIYAVRTVAIVDGQRVESELSNEVEGKFSVSE